MTRRRSPRGIIHESLERRRRLEADVRPRRVVGAFGRGRHVVESRDGGQRLVVPGPGFTFRPGALVPTARYSDVDRREVLLAFSSARGASEAPALTLRGSTPAPAAPLAPCELVTGKSYIGLWNDAPGDEIHAWRYTDGTYQEDLAVFDYGPFAWNLGTSFKGAVLAATREVIFFARRSGSNNDELARWSITPNTVLKIDAGAEDFDRPVIDGADVYVQLRDGCDSELWKGPASLSAAPTQQGAGFDWCSEYSGGGFPVGQWARLANGANLTAGTDFVDAGWAAFGGAKLSDAIDGGEAFDTTGYPATLLPDLTQVALIARENRAPGDSMRSVNAINNAGAETPLWPTQWATGAPGTSGDVRIAGSEYVFYDRTSGALYRGPITNASAETCAWPGVIVQAHPTEGVRPDVFLPE